LEGLAEQLLGSVFDSLAIAFPRVEYGLFEILNDWCLGNIDWALILMCWLIKMGGGLLIYTNSLPTIIAGD
jgi:hypothetical protein